MEVITQGTQLTKDQIVKRTTIQLTKPRTIQL